MGSRPSLAGVCKQRWSRNVACLQALQRARTRGASTLEYLLLVAAFLTAGILGLQAFAHEARSVAVCVAEEIGSLLGAAPADPSVCRSAERHASGNSIERSIFSTRAKPLALDDGLPGRQFAAATGVPGATTDASTAARRVIGYIYHAEGTLDGELRQYTGSTAQELRKRFSGHKFRTFLRDAATRVTAYEVLADPRADLSDRRTLRSAINEALRAVEEIHRSLASQNVDLKPLNLRRAASPENIQPWIERHSVVVEEGRPVRRGVIVRGLGLLTLLDAFKFGRDRHIEAQGLVQFPAVLADERGHFTVLSRKGPLDGLWGNEYWKFYVDGDAQGQNVPITGKEYDVYANEAEALYGYLDLFGNFQPGLLNPTLQHIELPPDIF